jgi:hypothetical protein
MKPLNEMTDDEHKYMDYAISAYAHHSSHLPDNSEYEKHLERFVQCLVRNFGFEPIKIFKHTQVPYTKEQLTQ